MRIRPGVAAVLTTLLTVVGAAGSGVLAADVTCRPTGFGGEARDGQVFEYPLSKDLVFRLAPERQSANPPGWRIEVRSRMMPEPENELSWVVSPPYRFWNPRYLDTSYGWSARDAVQFGKREFSFVVTEQEYRVAAAAVRKLLWPAGLAEGELEDARQTLASVRRATGSLVVLDSRVDERVPGPHGGPGRIEWVRFAVEVCLP